MSDKRMFKRDNLSGIPKDTKHHWFILPGKVILWFFYMFPTGGYANTRKSARWARSPIVTIVTACLFWAVLFFGGIFLAIGALAYG